MRHLIIIISFCALSFSLHGQETDSIPAPWNKLDMTGGHMKPFNVATTHKGFPWLPVVGATTAGGIVTYFITKDDEPGDPAPVARDDAITIQCETDGSIDVLTNDDGVGIRIVSVSSASAEISFTGSTVTITGATQSFTVTVIIADDQGRQAESTLTVNINSTPSLAVADDYVTPFETSLSENVLVNDSGQNIRVTDFTQPSDGVVSITSDGNLMYTPAEGFSGTISLNYTILGDCDQQATSTVTITVLPPDCTFSAIATIQDARCGQNDGAASVTVDPTGAYTYAWSEGSTGSNVEMIAPGNYTVTITSPDGNCEEVLDITIGELPLDLSATFETTEAGCGQSDGVATIIIDPAGSYDYVWSSGQTVATADGLTTGSYSVTVTISGTDCSQEFQVQIDESAPTFTATFETTDVSCDQADGSATVSVDPPDNYEYQWSNGTTEASASGLTPGVYTVTVTLSGTDCSLSFDVTVNQVLPEFEASFTITTANCGLADGSAAVTVTPGGTYSYLWSNGVSEATNGNLNQGTYTVTVTDVNGCTGEFSTTVDEAPAEYIANVSTTPGNCLGEGADIVITVETAGSGPFELTVTGSFGTTVVPVAIGTTNLKDLLILTPGSYQIIATDLSAGPSCTDEVNVTIEDNSPELSALDDAYETEVSTPVSGNVLDNDSGLDLTITSNTEPSSGELVLQENGNFTFTPPQGVTGQFMFQYTVEDACGNSETRQVIITVILGDCTIAISVQITDANCGLNDGFIDLTVIPAGSYTFEWSTGDIGEDLSNFGAGDYSVTVTSSDLSCSIDTSVAIGEIESVHIVDVSTTSSDCTGDGNISIELITSGPGPLIVLVTGPQVNEMLSLDPGLYQLEDFFNLFPGVYDIEVYDQEAGPECLDQTSVSVGDNTPALVAVDDTYNTGFEMPITSNFLDNDSGFNITVSSVANIAGGALIFDNDGNFTFTPDPGFIGNASFEYTITDTCGDMATALVLIIVEAGVCDFGANFVVTNASCGVADGILDVFADPPGNYTFVWSSGETTPTIIVGVGFFTVTITDQDLGCDLEFSVDMFEDPAAYISDLTIDDGLCSAPGNISFVVSSPGPGPMEMTVDGPMGLMTFPISEGLVSLMDFLEVTSGDYIITVADLSLGVNCTETVVVTVNGSESPVIAIEGIVHPTTFTSNDGSITVVFTTVGSGTTFTILLDGDVIGMAIPPVFTISELSVGTYTVEILDDLGCTSNALIADLIAGGGAPMSAGVSMSAMQNSIPELATVVDHQMHWQPTMFIAYRTRILSFDQVSRIDLFSGRHYLDRTQANVVRIQHLVGKHLQYGASTFSVSAGSAVALSPHTQQSPVYLVASVGMETSISNMFTLQATGRADRLEGVWLPSFAMSVVFSIR